MDLLLISKKKNSQIAKQSREDKITKQYINENVCCLKIIK